ncbi:MAG: WD40/YVTN/BNR-like repeat-containing protein, partial [Solirubrobacteraceae bacterium]
LYRSRDRGRSWQRIGLERSSRISRIVVDPADERRIFVAASGPLFQPGGERGLYRSEDGGDTWQLVLAGDNATTGATDVAIDPSNPQRMFAAMWDHQREPDVRRYNGVGSGLYRSDDGGGSWERVPGPQFGPDGALGRIGVAIAPSDPKTVFVMASGESGAYRGMFKSTDGGATWVPIAHPLVVADPVVYGWWFGRVWVDPQDASHVFVAGLFLIESKDGGLTWDSAPGVHADQHAMAWDPKQPGRVYLGNDGGVYRSDENGANWRFGSHQPFSQLYGLDVSEQDADRRTAGLQDNGAIRSYPGDYNEFKGGDGQRTLIDPRDQQVVFGCSQYGDCIKSTDGGETGEDITNKVISTRKNWFTPIELDPEDSKVVYTGGEILNRSTDGGETFETISGDLSNGPGRETNPLFRNFGTLTTIAPAPRRTGVIYAGTDDGNVWSTADGGATWRKSTDPDLPRAWVTRLEVDPRDPRTAYVTFSGFRQGADGAYVLETTDGGRNWESITGNLPKAPLNDVNVIGGELYVASDVGVFLSRDGGRRWLRVGGNLPLAPVFELRHHPATDTLYAATFGRSMWRIPLAALRAG